jgi:hypothetical protein
MEVGPKIGSVETTKNTSFEMENTMNTRINNLFVVCCAVATLGLTSGCGEVTEIERGVMELGGGQEAPPEQRGYEWAPGAVLRAETNDDVRGPVDMEFEQEPTWDAQQLELPEVEERMEYVPDNGDAIETEDIIEELTFDPFSNGCAGGEEWERFSERVCEKQGLALEEMNMEHDCSEGGHRMTQFACSDTAQHGTDSTPAKFKAFMLGGNGACKDMDSYWGQAERLCGPNGRLMMKEPLASCDSESDVPSYAVVRFVCKNK